MSTYVNQFAGVAQRTEERDTYDEMVRMNRRPFSEAEDWPGETAHVIMAPCISS